MNEFIEVIDFREFAEGMKEHWHGDPVHTPVFNNPYSIIQYPQHLWSTDIINMSFKFKLGTETVGYTSAHNISDSIVRTRGIYILPKFRGRGFGFQIMLSTWHYFPCSVGVEFFKDSVAASFIRKGMDIVPGTGPMWSEFSKCFLYLLYLPYTSLQPSPMEEFKTLYRDEFSLGGTRNLNVSWRQAEWDEYFSIHAGKYPERIDSALLSSILK
jgi:hypothetical protein